MKTIEFEGELYYSLEECKECDGYGTDYWLSKEGTLISTKRGKIKALKITLNHAGYLEVPLSLNGTQKRKRVHRLLVSQFLLNGEAIPKHLECDHINRERADNRLENLRLVDKQTNLDNRDTSNIGSYIRSESQIETLRNNLKKASEALYKKVKVYDYFTKEFIGEFNSIKQASEVLQVRYKSIGEHLKGKQKRVSTHRGISPKRWYTFEYAE